MTNPDVDDRTDSGFFADMFAGFSLGLSGLTDEVKKLNSHNERQTIAGRRNLPRQIPIVRESVSATTIDLLEFGDGPQPGRKWEIRILGVYSVRSDTGVYVTMATTVGTWFVGQKAGSLTAAILNPLQIRWQFASVPAFNDYSGDQLQVLPGEKLYLGLTGIPAAPTQIYGLAIVDDMPNFVGGVEATI